MKTIKIDTITDRIEVVDDFIQSKKGYFYLIKVEDNSLLLLNPDIHRINKNEFKNSFLLNYIHGNNKEFYNKLINDDFNSVISK